MILIEAILMDYRKSLLSAVALERVLANDSCMSPASTVSLQFDVVGSSLIFWHPTRPNVRTQAQIKTQCLNMIIR